MPKITQLARFIILVIALTACATVACAAGSLVEVRGIVRDSLSTDGLPFASVRVEPGHISTLTDAGGVFEISAPRSAQNLLISCQGYRAKSVPLWTNSLNLYDIYMTPEATELQELVVGKERYSKRNNPAVDFVTRLRRSSDIGDPRRNDYYSYERYERISFGVNDFDTTAHAADNSRFAFLKEHVDTSEISGKPVLSLSVNEKASTVLYRRNPRAERELVRGTRQRGVDEVMDQANIQTILFDVLREIDLYQNDIMLMRNSFVSPLSPLGPDCYRYYLVDSAMVDGENCVVLAFYPRGHIVNGFNGHIYVAANDTAMTIRRVDMHAPRNHHLNFIKNLIISQTFERAADGSRLKTSDNLVMDMKVLPGAPEVYASRKINYTGHSFAHHEGMDTVFDAIGPQVIQQGASERGEEFWNRARTISESDGESRIDELMRRLRSVPLYYWGEKFLNRMVTGYVPIGRNALFDYGPLNTTVSYNGLEGMRLRAGGMTTTQLSRHWFGRGYAAYGCRDHKWKYSGEVEYSFTPKQIHSREFPVHSLRLSHTYDVDRLGSHYLFTNPDNFVLSWTRMSARLDTYRRATRLQYTLELTNNFSVEAAVEHVRQEQSPYVHFVNAAGDDFGHYGQTAFEVQLRYAPGEKFYQMRTARIPINFNAPTFVLRHRYSPKGFLGSRYAVNRTEFNFSKRFWLSVAGQLDVMIGAGYVWSSSPFPELLIPNANLSYTIQPQSFALMNPLEFINSEYVSADITYHANGLLLNLIPGVRNLKLREIIGFRAIYGHLDKRNTPGEANPQLPLFPADATTRDMNHGPYMELNAGLDNIFHFLRVDYVYRINYRNVPYDIDRQGIRVALHFNF